MNVFAVSVVVCLFGGTMADDPVSVMFTGSGSAGGLLGCKPRSTSSGRGARVRFQALRTGGVEYTRKLVPSERMTYSDVVATNSSSKNIAECAKTAAGKKWDAFSFVNDQCVGYKIGNEICACREGNFVLYLAKSAIRSPSSAKAFTAAKGRAAAAPLPAGYIRKTIYPTVSLTGGIFASEAIDCETLITLVGATEWLLLYFADGRCHYTVAFSPYPCDSCAGTATEVIVNDRTEYPYQETHLLSNCGATIAAKLHTRANVAAASYEYVLIYSHEGYGCIPYSDPASAGNCDITVLGPAGTVRLSVSLFLDYIDIDGSPGVTCDGDELYLYPGPADGSPCIKAAALGNRPTLVTGNRVTIRFQRKPDYNKNSVNRGFVIIVLAYDFMYV